MKGCLPAGSEFQKKYDYTSLRRGKYTLSRAPGGELFFPGRGPVHEGL